MKRRLGHKFPKQAIKIQLIYHCHIDSMIIFHATTQTSNRAILEVLRSIYEKKNLLYLGQSANIRYYMEEL